MFSIKNSFDYKIKNNNIINKLPFTGEYEALDNYKFIYIYVNLADGITDNLTIQFTNKKNDSSYEIEDTSYNGIFGENEIVIAKKLKYFRIKINNDSYISSDKRIYNTYYLDTQYTKSSGSPSGNVTIIDEQGRDATVTIGGSLNVNMTNASIPVTNSDLTSIKTAVELIDNAVSGNYIATKLNDVSGNGIYSTSNALNVNMQNNSLLISGDISKEYPSYTSGTTNNLSLSTSGELRVTENSYNLHKDAFNRLRISNPFTLFDSKNIDKKNNKFTEYKTNSSGITYNVNSSIVSLNCDVSNTIVIRESKNRFSYQPGKSLLIMNTFVFGNVINNISNSIQRVGYFDDYNGIFLQIDASGVNIVRRSNSSGTITNTSIQLSNWNGDTIAQNLDFGYSQIFWIDIEWLGVGSIRTGFVLDGQFILAHTFHHANIIQSTSITSAQLPIRYEIRRISSDSSLKQICSTVISEGGYEGNSILRHVGTHDAESLITTSFPVDTSRVICGIRIAKDSNNIPYNSIIIPSQLTIYLNNTVGNSNASYPIVTYTIILNPTLTGTPAWTKVSSTYTDDTSSVVEYFLHKNTGVNPTYTLDTGLVVNSGFLENRTTINLSSNKDFNLQLGRIITGYSSDKLTYDSDIMAVVLRCVYAGSGSSITNVAYKIGWYEI